MNSFNIIKTVRLTEKGTRQGEKYNQYTLVCDRLATKIQIRKAVEDLFKVKVLSCFGSQPICSTRLPNLLKATDRFDEVVLLPIPPLP